MHDCILLVIRLLFFLLLVLRFVLLLSDLLLIQFAFIEKQGVDYLFPFEPSYVSYYRKVRTGLACS